MGKLKNPDNKIVVNKSMFVLTILENIKETKLKFSQQGVTVLLKTTNYQEPKV